jgi:hypothetical protein
MSKQSFKRRGSLAACALVISFGLLPAAAHAADPAPAKTAAATKPAAPKVAKSGAVTQESAQAAFDSFAREWMKKMHAGSISVRESNKVTAKKSNATLKFNQYADEFTTELKRTSSTSAPFVGLLRYVEKEYACADATDAKCQVASETNVTEIFRFERGQWIY